MQIHEQPRHPGQAALYRPVRHTLPIADRLQPTDAAVPVRGNQPEQVSAPNVVLLD
jgi:hypothetical protein